MIPNEDLERLLTDHAAAVECGLLHDGLTPNEMARVAAQRALRPRRPWFGRSVVAAAAALLVGVGLWAWLSWSKPTSFLDGRGRVAAVSA